MAYEGRSIGVTKDALTIGGYYFPGTVKRIPVGTIGSVRRADMATLRGRGRSKRDLTASWRSRAAAS